MNTPAHVPPPPSRLVRFGRRWCDRVALALRIGSRHCAVCESHVRRFVPLFEADPGLYEALTAAGFDLDVFRSAETLNLGAYACPRCGASDRDRLYAMFFDRHLASSSPEQPVRLLDIAPAPALGPRLRGHPAVSYRSADLFAPGVDDRVDLTDMSIYADGCWDVVICSHVLEHIDDDGAAMREIARVLSPDGVAIVMVPLSSAITETRESDSDDPIERTRVCGQSDHVRWYERDDFLRRLGDAGLSVRAYQPGDLSDDPPHRIGIEADARLYIASRDRTAS